MAQQALRERADVEFGSECARLRLGRVFRLCQEPPRDRRRRGEVGRKLTEAMVVQLGLAISAETTSRDANINREPCSLLCTWHDEQPSGRGGAKRREKEQREGHTDAREARGSPADSADHRVRFRYSRHVDRTPDFANRWPEIVDA